MHVTTVPGDARRDALVRQYQEEWPGGVCVHADPDRRGILWNHRTVLDCLLEEGSPWGLTCQDDVVFLPGWEDHLLSVMWYAPTPFVSLGHLSKYGARLAAKQVPFGVGVNALWGQAVLYRKDVLPAYRELVERVWDLDAGSGMYRKWDDGLAAVFNLLTGTRSSFTAWSLVEHQNWESTVGNVPGRWRHAECTIVGALPTVWGKVPRTASAGVSPDELQKSLARRLGWVK